MGNWITIDARTGNYTGIDITPAQANTLDAIIKRLPEFDFYGHPDRYEIKALDISQAEPDQELTVLLSSAGIRTSRPAIFVSITTGMIDDDGTLASIYSRKYRHLKIGPRGGISSAPATASRSGFRPVSLFEALNSEYWT